MQEDNAYRRGTPPQIVPSDQEKEAHEQRQRVRDEYPVINDVIEHLDACINSLGSIDAIPVSVTTNPEKFMHTVAGNRIAKGVLEAERQALIELLTEHTK